MKVREALTEVFSKSIGNERRWSYRAKGFVDVDNSNQVLSNNTYMGSLSQDRKVLESNFDSEVLMLDHVGFVGLLGFKMRNGRPALFMFNNPKSVRDIQRVEGQRTIDTYNEFKSSIKESHNLKNEEFELWLSLKVITGGSFK